MNAVAAVNRIKSFQHLLEPPPFYQFGIALLFGLVYVLAAEVGHWLSLGANVATCWPPSGIYLMALVSTPKIKWRYLIASGVTANLLSDTILNDKPLALSMCWTLANTTEATLGAWILTWRASADFSLERLPDIKRLLGVSMFAPMVSACIAAPAVYFIVSGSLINTYFVWWIADCVGILTVAPLTWALLRWRVQQQTNWLNTVELVGSFALMALATTIVFSDLFPAVSFPFLLMPFLYWPALRFGTVAVAAHIALMATIIIYATQHNIGPFADAEFRAVVLQAFLATCSVPFLALAAMWHEREQATEEMERRIELRTQQLADADRRKDHFLAVLAHELRNPLAPLTHAIEIWPRVAAEPEKLIELRTMMANQLRHMSGLIDDLLDVSRIAGGKILLRHDRIDLRDTVVEAVQSAHSQAQSAGHTVNVCMPPQPVWMIGDRARLSQIVGNLLNNAIKYTGQHGQIKVAVEVENGQARISVEDNGPGIPPEQLNRIFDLFTQVDQTLERAHGGLGIGLTLVKNLVELHGGTVFAHSPGLGKGSVFCVSLPLADSQEQCHNVSKEATSTMDRDENAKLPNQRILVVDDTHASGKMLSLLLKSLGQEVEVCLDGPSALDKAVEFKPSLIFLDIAMPGMSGYEVAARLKADPVTSEIVLVAMTGFGQASDRQRAFDCGFDHHMIKPASLDALKQVIQWSENANA